MQCGTPLPDSVRVTATGRDGKQPPNDGHLMRLCPRTEFLLFIVVLVTCWLVMGTVFVPNLYSDNPDSYLRLVLAQDFFHGAAWDAHHFARINPPFGMDTPWTRPVDLLLVPGAWMLGFFLPDRLAWMAWAAVLPPLMAGVAGLLVLRILQRLQQPEVVQFTGLSLFLLNIFTQSYFGTFYTDHHFLLCLCLLLAVWGGIGAVQQPETCRPAVLAGAATGLGIWTSPEFLLPAAGMLLGLGLVWVRFAARLHLPHLLVAAVLVLLPAVGLERPDPLVVVHDSVSVVHVTLFALLAGVAWVLVAVAGAWRAWLRLGASVFALAAVFAVMLSLFPGFYLAHYAVVDPFLQREFLPYVNELRPLLDSPGVRPTGFLLLLLGVGGLGMVGFRLCQQGSTATDWVWLVVCVPALLVGIAGLLQIRWFTYAMAVLPIVAAPFCGVVLVPVAAKIRQWMGFGVLVPCLLLGIILPLLVMVGMNRMGERAAGQPDRAQQDHNRCSARYRQFIMADGFSRLAGDDAPAVIMTNGNSAGLVWFWTPHSVVFGNYHRDEAGMRDGITFFRSRDPARAREILVRRNVGWVAYCKGDFLTRDGFFLDKGPVPDWLVPVETGVDPGLRVYRVRKP